MEDFFAQGYKKIIINTYLAGKQYVDEGTISQDELIQNICDGLVKADPELKPTKEGTYSILVSAGLIK